MNLMWTLQDAKARFSAVVDAALAGEPQAVTRRGKAAVVVVGAEEWARTVAAARATGFAAHLAAIPRGSEDGREGANDGADPFARVALTARDIDL
jgi:prevent-host-death family protein